MNLFNPMPPSGLLQRQPQRYSDRHQQQLSGSADFQPRGWYAALHRRSVDAGKKSGTQLQSK